MSWRVLLQTQEPLDSATLQLVLSLFTSCIGIPLCSDQALATLCHDRPCITDAVQMKKSPVCILGTKQAHKVSESSEKRLKDGQRRPEAPVAPECWLGTLGDWWHPGLFRYLHHPSCYLEKEENLSAFKLPGGQD